MYVCVPICLQVKFSLDFGPALGGKFTAKPVAAFLDPFIRDTLANLLVWPNRWEVPIMRVVTLLLLLLYHKELLLRVSICDAGPQLKQLVVYQISAG